MISILTNREIIYALRKLMFSVWIVAFCLICWKCDFLYICNFAYYFCILYFMYRLIYCLIDFIAVFWDIYHEILRTAFLPKAANDCSYKLENRFRNNKITCNSSKFAVIIFQRFGNKMELSILIEFRNLLFKNKYLIHV